MIHIALDDTKWPFLYTCDTHTVLVIMESFFQPRKRKSVVLIDEEKEESSNNDAEVAGISLKSTVIRSKMFP